MNGNVGGEALFIDAAAVPGEAADRLIALWLKVWPNRDGSYYRKRLDTMSLLDTAGKPCGYVVLESESAHAAQCMIFPRTIRTASGDMTVMALGGVCVDPALRGKRLGRRVVEAAFSFAGNNVDRNAYDICLFQTSFRVQPFYEKLGCRRVENRFVNSLAGTDLTPEELKRSVFWDDVVMIYPAAAEWPEGDIDLLGNAY